MHKTAIVTDRRYLKHFAGRSHPERPERIAVMIEMAESLTRDHLKFMRAARGHARGNRALSSPRVYRDGGAHLALDRFDFDPDTHTSRDTYETALLAAGGVLTAVEAVLDGAVENAIRYSASAGASRAA